MEHYGLTDATYARLRYMQRYLASSGYRLTVRSGRRDSVEQGSLYFRYITGQTDVPAAPPGQSAHERGEAFDVRASSGGLHLAAGLAPYIGLRWGGTFSRPDPNHFELRR